MLRHLRDVASTTVTAARPWRLCSGGSGGLRRLCSSNGIMPAAGGPQGLGAVNSADEIPTLKLYRDCMRLTYHIAARSAKGDAMRAMVRQQFRTQMHVTDEQEIHRLKMLAVVGLQNYVIHEQTGKALEDRRRSRAKQPESPEK